jgi:hypothetical protein
MGRFDGDICTPDTGVRRDLLGRFNLDPEVASTKPLQNQANGSRRVKGTNTIRFSSTWQLIDNN